MLHKLLEPNGFIILLFYFVKQFQLTEKLAEEAPISLCESSIEFQDDRDIKQKIWVHFQGREF